MGKINIKKTNYELKIKKSDISQYKKPNEIPILPLRNTVLFPNHSIPLYIGREHSLALLNSIKNGNRLFAVVSQTDISNENPTFDNVYKYGTLAILEKIVNMPNQFISIFIQGLERVKIHSFEKNKNPFYTGTIEIIEETKLNRTESPKNVKIIKSLFNKLSKKTKYITMDHVNFINEIYSLSSLIDNITAIIQIPIPKKQAILQTANIKNRMNLIIEFLNEAIQSTEIEKKINSDVNNALNENQRKHVLRQKLIAIQKELGEDDVETEELSEKLEKAKLSKEAKVTAEKEMNRLKRIPKISPEYNMIRTYLEWLSDLPWEKTTNDNLQISKAEKILNEDHYGLDKVKLRILEYLAVRKLKLQKDKNSAVKGPILCFIGPPGVGKTSVGKSIARAMGREFYRISLGGIRDESEIRGHRRTYIGSLPGRIIKGMQKVGVNNPIFMLDEIDKLGNDFRGDPSSALLEVLDPEQNYSFTDNYLEVPFDLQNVMFIATANWYETIPGPLRDRMEFISFSGYLVDEKIQIANKFLIPKQIEEHGLTSRNISFTKKSVELIIEEYTKESGVRDLERQIAKICRKVAKSIVESIKKSKVVITNDEVRKYLGIQKFYSEVAERMVKPGIAIGLAWTVVGGDILFIEASKMSGKGELILTGQLGDVMKESAQATMSFIRANSKKLKIDSNFNTKYDIHIHIPAGAIPKDGPSAGITLLTAIVSVLTDKKVKNNIAMTGEITLRGTVLPVGGIKEKVIAAYRAGLREIILPEKNEDDLKEIQKKVLKKIKFHFVKDMLDVIKIAIEK
ncbi:MAG: endopeptidase La [Candidatus Marinimicrobia bacterium]|nr:endopeptidase La [Candidatus Neomarinimicrobiota bacterium]